VDQLLREMGSDEAGAACNEVVRHSAEVGSKILAAARLRSAESLALLVVRLKARDTSRSGEAV